VSAGKRTFKFLAAGAVSPISRFRWPDPGVWVDAAEAPAPCRAGVHVCRTAELPYWIADELWEVEVEGPLIDAPAAVVARRARLLRRIEGWDRSGGGAFTAACVDRAMSVAAGASADLRELVAGYAADARGFREQSLWCTSAYVAACAAIVAAPDRPAHDVLREERAWQGEVLASQLDLN
jgi:hypothetical protein